MKEVGGDHPDLKRKGRKNVKEDGTKLFHEICKILEEKVPRDWEI